MGVNFDESIFLLLTDFGVHFSSDVSGEKQRGSSENSNGGGVIQKFGGNLGESGVAAHQFKQAGVIRIDKKKISDNDILELAINSGAEDCLSKALFHEIITAKENFYKVKTAIEKKVQEFISTGIEWMPINKISLDQEKTKSVLNFLETLEDDDDVQHVYANLEINNNFTEKNSKA